MSADKYPERHKRDLLLSDRISQGTVKDIIKDIFEINFDDDEKEEIYKDWEQNPYNCLSIRTGEACSTDLLL